MSCVPELYALSKSKIKAELDLPNYAKKNKKNLTLNSSRS